jgi:hypothetical protein
MIHFCEWITASKLEERGCSTYIIPTEHCGKVAHFKHDLGAWYCAEHWDEHQRLGLSMQYVGPGD